MKKEFINQLQSDEEILFYGIFNVNKTSKQYGRFLLGCVFLLLFWILFVIGVKSESGLNFKILIFFLVLSMLTICLIYGLIYNTFIKYKNKNNEYFVTNKRIAIYNSKSGFRIENICDIEHIGIVREKNNYGDIMFNFYASNLIDQMKNGMNISSSLCPAETTVEVGDRRVIPS